MQIRAHEKKNILISGIFVFSLLLIVAVSIFFLGKENSLFEQKIYLYTKVLNAQNLKTGAFIQFKGIKIGTVNSIDVHGLTDIRIQLHIKKNMQRWIRENSYMTFNTQGVLGDKFLEILGGSADSPIISENSLIQTRLGTNFKKIITQGENIIVTASRVLNKLDIILDAIGPEVLTSTLKNINETTIHTKKLITSFNKKDIENLNSAIAGISSNLNSLNNITTRVQRGPGTLHSLIYDQSTHDDLKQLLGGANRSKILKYFIRESIEKSKH